jgi:alpha-amylase/alpha-mannosidase (GH57 family)
MSIRQICVHGHFYQPPREDPITGLIPSEAGADPYKNWNERIHAECYKPNAELGNFERISFNLGPTLYAWMEEYHPETCRLILTQDRANLQRFGMGNAIAQAYNHMILPLASYADKVTQVYWGIADFKHRFGRKPQGMWLPETGRGYRDPWRFSGPWHRIYHSGSLAGQCGSGGSDRAIPCCLARWQEHHGIFLPAELSTA